MDSKNQKIAKLAEEAQAIARNQDTRQWLYNYELGRFPPNFYGVVRAGWVDWWYDEMQLILYLQQILPVIKTLAERKEWQDCNLRFKEIMGANIGPDNCFPMMYVKRNEKVLLTVEFHPEVPAESFDHGFKVILRDFRTTDSYTGARRHDVPDMATLLHFLKRTGPFSSRRK